MPSGDESDRRLAGRFAVVIFAVLALAAAAVAVASARSVAAGDQSRVTAAATRAATPSQRRAFLLGLPQRGNPGLFASQVSDPSSRRYRHFLSLGQYQARFSASTAARRAALRYLASQRGVISVQLSSDKSVVLAVLTSQAGQRLFCARGLTAPTGGLLHAADSAPMGARDLGR